MQPKNKTEQRKKTHNLKVSLISFLEPSNTSQMNVEVKGETAPKKKKGLEYLTMSLHLASRQQNLDLNPHPFDHVPAFVNSSPEYTETMHTSV